MIAILFLMHKNVVFEKRTVTYPVLKHLNSKHKCISLYNVITLFADKNEKLLKIVAQSLQFHFDCIKM